MKNSNSILSVPRREFGNSGVYISKLCLGGGSFGVTNSKVLLDEALKYGVDCWEIVSFTGKAYSEYFDKHPEIREKIFLTGKVFSIDPGIMEEQLNRTLEDNGTEMIDFLAVHQISDIKVLSEDVRKWVEKVKKEKKIRFFGFCTHKNMANCLADACSLGWIDGIQTVYNYRMRNIGQMEESMQKCNEKGIGLLAVKSMGLSVQRKEELHKLPAREHLDSLLANNNMTFEQLKLKYIWANPNLTSICSLMPDLTILESNASAAIDENPINHDIAESLIDYANTTGKYFCRRCGACDTANADKVPVFSIMEMLMYSRKYGIKDLIAQSFDRIPDEIRSKIPTSNYSDAEKICPQKIPIAQLMKDADKEFTKGTVHR